MQQNNPKIDKPKDTVRGLQRVDCLCLSPSKENTSDTERRYCKGQNENARFIFFVKTPVMLRMQEKFSFSLLWEIDRAAAEIFCNCEYKRRWFIWQSNCGSHNDRVWGLWHWHAHTSYSLVWSSVLQLTQSSFFSMSGLCPKVSERLAHGFRSSPITNEGTASGNDSLAKGSCPSS